MLNYLSVAHNVGTAITIFFAASSGVAGEVVANPSSRLNVQQPKLAAVILAPQKDRGTKDKSTPDAAPQTPQPAQFVTPTPPQPAEFAPPTPVVTSQPPSTPSETQTPTSGNTKSMDGEASAVPSFWTTAPGVLTAVAAFISAIAALIVALTRRGKSD